MRSRSGLAAKAALLVLFSLPVQAEITITQLAQQGFVISDRTTRLMIDGMVVDSYSVYGGLPADAAAQFDAIAGPFADIDLALVSHRHHEHNQPEHACRFMQASQGSKLVTSEQVIGLMREKCRSFMTSSPRVRTISPQYDRHEHFTVGTARVTVFPLSHGTRKYARIQNFGHLIEMGGVNLLHVGDAAIDPADFEKAGLDDIRIDVAFIPFRYLQPGPGADIVERFLDAPLKIAAHIPPGEMEEVKAHIEANFPNVLVLDHPLAETRFIAPPPSPQ